MNTIKGKNIVCSMDVGGTYYPIFCAKNAEFNVNQDEIETTSVNSGSSREYDPGMMNATLSMTGVTTLNNTNGRISPLYLMQQSIRRATQSLIINLTDDDGADVVIDFSAIITATGFTRDVASYSQCSVNFRVTGDINFDTVITPPAPSEVFSIYLSTTAGNTTVSDAALTGKEVLLVAREGSVYNETTGTPTGRYFKFTSGTGTITFDSSIPFNTGEVVYVEYKT
jgi:hypothetical protein